MKPIDLKRKQPATVRRLALEERVLLVTPLGERCLHNRVQELREEDLRLRGELGKSIENYPDLRENASFDEINNKLEQQIPRELIDLRDMLAVAQVYEDMSAGVRLGCRVKLSMSDKEQDFLFAGPVEASMAVEHRPTPLSYLSPVGQAIWGRAVGTIVEVNEQTVEILDIEPLDTQSVGL